MYTSDEPKKGSMVLPPQGADDFEIQGWKDQFFNREANYRCKHLGRMTRNEHYVLGHQWQGNGSSYRETSNGYSISYLGGSSENEIPKPVINRLALGVKAEKAAFSKAQLVPKVTPTSSDPEIESAAKTATAVMQHQMRKQNWPLIRQLSTHTFIVDGPAIIKSFWDATYEKTSRIGSPEAIECPECDFKSASASKPLEPGQEESEEYSECPHCKGPLQPMDVGPEDAENGVDSLGAPLGMDVPIGQPAMEVILPWELFLENSGINFRSDKVRLIGHVCPRSMDWVEERYPDKFEKVEVSDPHEIMRWHPILGEWTLSSTYSADIEEGIYDNHVLVYEVYHEKSYRYPLGRKVVLTDDVVLEDVDLYREIEDEEGNKQEVSLAKIGFARWEERIGEFWPKSYCDDLISLQNQLNGQASQAIEARSRMGSPNMIIPGTVEINGPEWDEDWGSGKLMRYEPDPMNPGARPEVIGATGVDASLWQEQDRLMQHFEAMGGPPPVSRGEAPKNVGTTSGLQLLNEGVAQMRQTQEDALITLYETIWKHQLEMLSLLRLESDGDTYDKESDSGAYESKPLTGKDIAGQTRVKIEKQAYIDKSIYVKEGAREAQIDGLYNVDTPEARIRLLELRGLPTDVNEGTSKQILRARKQWSEFRDSKIIPIIDESLDDPSIHFNILATALMDDVGAALAEEAAWPEIMRKLAGWQAPFGQAYAADQAAREYYGGVPEDPEGAYNEAMMGYQQQVDAFNVQNEQITANAIADEQTKIPENVLMAQPPQQPPPPSFLPAALQDKIRVIWDDILRKGAGMDQMTGQPLPSLPTTPNSAMFEGSPIAAEVDADASQSQQDFISFRAVVDAYKWMLEASQQAAAAPQGSPPADMTAAPLNNFSSPPTPPEVSAQQL